MTTRGTIEKKKKEIFPGGGEKSLYLRWLCYKDDYDISEALVGGFGSRNRTLFSLYGKHFCFHIYIYIEWWKDRYRRGGGLLSMIIIGAIVTPLCRLRYGEITCSNNRWFWKRQLIEEGCNLCVRWTLPLPSFLSFTCEREREQEKINNQISDNSLSSDLLSF